MPRITLGVLQILLTLTKVSRYYLFQPPDIHTFALRTGLHSVTVVCPGWHLCLGRPILRAPLKVAVNFWAVLTRDGENESPIHLIFIYWVHTVGPRVLTWEKKTFVIKSLIDATLMYLGADWKGNIPRLPSYCNEHCPLSITHLQARLPVLGNEMWYS